MEFWIIVWESDFLKKKRVKLKLFENLKFWKSNVKIGVSKIIWKLKFWKLNLRIGILKNYLKVEVLKIKFGNWNFEELFENGSLKN